MLDGWISTTEAAQISGYHIELIRRLVRSGQNHARKWGKEWMVDKASFFEYLKKEKKPGPKPSSK